MRVAEREERALGERDDRVRALEPRHRAGDRFLERPRSFAISAAITSLSDVEESVMPSSASSSRSAGAFVRLPLCPSATVRARPWWTSGCAFAQRVEPVVE